VASPPEQYIKDVLSGKILVSEYARKAVERHVNDLKKQGTKKFSFTFDPSEGQRVIKFFSLLRHSKGEWAGSVFQLAPWQEFLIYVVFGWRTIEKTRRFRTVYLEVPRKNGKTTLAAGIGLYLLRGDNEPGAEIYAAATKYDQAKLCHTEAVRMVKSSPGLRGRISVYRNNLSIDETNSKFEPVGRDHDTLDGLNIHGAIIDELHVHKTREMWDVIDTGTGSRRQPLIFCITTAGFDRQSICWENHEYVEKILDGIINDETFFGIIYTVDEGDNWNDESTWAKANPNYGISVYAHDLKRKAKKAAEMPSALNAFLRKHLDIWTQSETAWLTHELWGACSMPVDPDGLKGRMCYAGLDLSTNIDVTAFVMVFPPETENDQFKVLCRFFIPQDSIEVRVRRDRVPYDVWVRQGFIMATPGNRIDLKFVVDQIDQDATTYDLMQIAYDRWGAAQVVADLQELGYDEEPGDDDEQIARCLVRFGQGYASMSSPAKELERLVLGREIAHGGNPVLTWMMSNVIMSEDPAGNIKPDKKKSTEKIDGVVALLMGLDRAIRHQHEKSVYEERGILFL
jgi:phage terminase large subunit-like protein